MNTHDELEAQPCAFCGSTDTICVRDPRSQWGLWFVVICENDGCHAMGPARQTESDAVAAWGNRPSFSTPAPAVVDKESAKHIDTLEHLASQYLPGGPHDIKGAIRAAIDALKSSHTTKGEA